MSKPLFIALSAVLAASVAIAHTGVKNEAVKARMHGMDQISAATKVIGLMARGQSNFDADKLATQAAMLEAEATRIPTLFEAQEDDPKSEALPAIWENWDDFTLKSQEMGAAAATLATITSSDDLSAAFRALGQTCSACHKAYRE